MPRAKTTPAPPVKTPRKRPAGRPAQPVLSPEDVFDIGELWLTGHTQQEIAKRYGVHWTSIQHHIDSKIRPGWEAEVAERRGELVAKVAALARVAWRCFRDSQSPETRKQIKQALVGEGADLKTVEMVAAEISRTGHVAYLDVVRWCLDWQTKVEGHYRKPAEDEAAARMQTGERPLAVMVTVQSREEAEEARTFKDWMRRVRRGESAHEAN